MLDLIERLWFAAPPASLFVVESNPEFNNGLLPEPHAWDTRIYLPAVISIGEKPATHSA